MQQKMLDAQSELDNVEVKGEAGGGLVKVVATAKGNFKNIEIDESILSDKPSNLFNKFDTSERVVGQISGQLRKPKKITFSFDELYKWYLLLL